MGYPNNYQNNKRNLRSYLFTMKDVKHQQNVHWKQAMQKAALTYARLSYVIQTSILSLLNTSEKLDKKSKRNMRLLLRNTSQNSAAYAKQLYLKELSRQLRMQRWQEEKQQDSTSNKK